MRRVILSSAVLALAASLQLGACKPPVDTFDAGCYPATISTPVLDGGVTDAGCLTWSGGCDSTGTAALHVAIQNAFNSGTCTADTDCGIYSPLINVNTFSMQCYQTSDIPPIVLSQRGAIDLQIAAVLCGFCQACGYDGDGGGVIQDAVNPPVDAGNCTEVSCISGACSAETFQE